MSCLGNGISFLYEFDLGNRNVLLPGANILSVTSQALGDFDKSNLFSDSTRHKWRSDGVLTWQEIIIQADQITDIDTFAILGHNLTEDAVVILEANISNNFLAPPVTITIPWQKNNMAWLENLGDNYEYYRLRILDPTNPCGFVEIGRIAGGRAFTMKDGEGISDDFSISSKDFAEQMKTEGFFRHSNERVKARTLGASTSKIDSKTGANTNFLGLRDVFETVGISIPLLVIADRTDPDLFLTWGQFRDIPTEGFSINRYVSMRFSFEEVF